MEDSQVFIKNPNNDFCIIQNYVIQLVAEKKISPHAFVLYAFYQSLNGFAEIHVGYRYIKENTKLSMGTISKCNEQLQENGLINIVKSGSNQTFVIELTPNQSIPRRTLKVPERNKKCSSDEQGVQDMNAKEEKCSSDEQIYIIQQDILDTNNTTTTATKKLNSTKEKNLKDHKNKPPVIFTSDESDFIDKFVSKWKLYTKSKYYTKSDFEAVKKLSDYEDAEKYIDVLWSLDDIDKWIRNSDHSLTIFVKEYLSGRLQALYPKTVYALIE